jgi:hypothetical protein
MPHSNSYIHSLQNNRGYTQSFPKRILSERQSERVGAQHEQHAVPALRSEADAPNSVPKGDWQIRLSLARHVPITITLAPT